MKKKIKVNRISKKGQPPGSLIYIGEERNHDTEIKTYKYSESIIERKTFDKNIDLKQFENTSSKLWIDVDGIHDISLVEKISHYFGIHALTIEDMLNTHQRPKMSDFDNYMYVTCKMLTMSSLINNKVFESEQISIILLKDKLITFQELPGDCFDEIRKRFDVETSKLRRYDTGYLLFLLLDYIVDDYIDAIELFRKDIENLEDKIVAHNSFVGINEIIQHKSLLINMHKEISPIKDIIYKILRSENTLIRVETHKYYNDLLDHADQVIEQIDFLLSINKSQQDLHFATLSLRMNKIMETLTIITAIFIPLTFIVGVYGMNFENMPELEYKYGYYITWGVMILIVFIMISWFKRRKWM